MVAEDDSGSLRLDHVYEDFEKPAGDGTEKNCRSQGQVVNLC